MELTVCSPDLGHIIPSIPVRLKGLHKNDDDEKPEQASL